MIYFVRCEQDTGDLKAGWIKIGTTCCLSERLKQIASSLGHVSTLLGVLDGGSAEERALHRKFAGGRECGEWFRPECLLLSLIEQEVMAWDGEDEKPKTTPFRITDEATKAARIASGYTGESMAEYVNRIIVERGREDVDRLYAEAKIEKPHRGRGGPK